MKNPVFTGAGVAIITPMYEDGSVNFDELGRIIEDQITRGTDAIVICGTTGECSTMTDEEQLAAIKFTVDTVNHRVPVIAGAGSNDTLHAAALARRYEAMGADGLLVVTPYYNKANKSGMLAHFRTIADGVNIPILLYNVPSRTGCNLLPATIEKLAEHPNIAAVKEASGNMSQVVELFARCGDKIDVYSGEDGLTVPMLAMGGMGTISVLSNVIPKGAVEMTDAFFAGDLQKAAALQCRYLDLINLLFCEVNPIPAKAAVSAMGYGKEFIRLPLTPMEEGNRAKLLAEMRKQGVAL